MVSERVSSLIEACEVLDCRTGIFQKIVAALGKVLSLLNRLEGIILHFLEYLNMIPRQDYVEVQENDELQENGDLKDSPNSTIVFFILILAVSLIGIISFHPSFDYYKSLIWIGFCTGAIVLLWGMNLIRKRSSLAFRFQFSVLIIGSFVGAICSSLLNYNWSIKFISFLIIVLVSMMSIEIMFYVFCLECLHPIYHLDLGKHVTGYYSNMLKGIYSTLYIVAFGLVFTSFVIFIAIDYHSIHGRRLRYCYHILFFILHSIGLFLFVQ